MLEFLFIFFFLSGSTMNLFLCIFGLLVIFTVVTMWAVLVTEGCRKIKLQYYAFKLASTERYFFLFTFSYKSFFSTESSNIRLCNLVFWSWRIIHDIYLMIELDHPSLKWNRISLSTLIRLECSLYSPLPIYWLFLVF